jgi:hypothetical protein
MKNIFLRRKNALAYYDAGVEAVPKFKSRTIGSVFFRRLLFGGRGSGPSVGPMLARGADVRRRLRNRRFAGRKADQKKLSVPRSTLRLCAVSELRGAASSGSW